MVVSIDEKNNYVYICGINFIIEILEKKIVCLECGEKCKVFVLGMGVILVMLFMLF